MYYVFFGVGAGFIIISLLIGEIGEFGDLDFGDLDLDVDGGSFFSFLKPMLIAVFLVVTGGVGLLLTANLSIVSGMILFISVLSGLTVAGLINRFVLIPLKNAQNTSAFNMQDTIGAAAEVISKIPQGGYGKIRYSISGSVVTSPAKSEDGNAIPGGEKVEIIYIEKNTYYVRRQSDEINAT